MGVLGGKKPYFGLTGGWLTFWITVRFVLIYTFVNVSYLSFVQFFLFFLFSSFNAIQTLLPLLTN